MRGLSVGAILVAGLALAACSQSGYRNLDEFVSNPSSWSVDAVTADAEAGDADSQRLLGSMYHWGDGVPQDDEKAAFWWSKAAANGDQTAQSYLDAPRNNKAEPGELHAGVAREWFTD
ncbi:MAG: tetratricopeptide repeat protein [Alphaproteobacteria bacterium]